MISVLIPVYNTDITKLVSDLKLQLNEKGVGFEIILIDDFSLPLYKETNRSLKGQDNVIYHESSFNKGRIDTRLELAKLAKYSWLLFIDADSAIIHTNYIERYLKSISDNNLNSGVIIGGRVYSNIVPANTNYILHWKYGSFREKRNLPITGEKMYRSFMSNNFMIKKEIFQSLNFKIGIEGYGHEDTWMGIQLELDKIPVLHIDNPVLHASLDDSNTFIKKSLEALHNIKQLLSAVDKNLLYKHIRIIRAAHLLHKTKTEPLFILFYSIVGKKIYNNLFSSNPSLIGFDLYRLRELLKIMRSAN